MQWPCALLENETCPLGRRHRYPQLRDNADQGTSCSMSGGHALRVACHDVNRGLFVPHRHAPHVFNDKTDADGLGDFLQQSLEPVAGLEFPLHDREV